MNIYRTKFVPENGVFVSAPEDQGACGWLHAEGAEPQLMKFVDRWMPMEEYREVKRAKKIRNGRFYRDHPFILAEKIRDKKYRKKEKGDIRDYVSCAGHRGVLEFVNLAAVR